MQTFPKRGHLLFFLYAALTLAVACAAYLNQHYHAGDAAAAAMQSDAAVTVVSQEDGTVTFSAGNPRQGLIFYPGGKVEHTAYAPLLRELAAGGWFCVLVRMPFYLAVLDANAAEGIREQYPEISSWYIGGHSLGGAMAANYAANTAEPFDGLVLLAAYSTEDLSHMDLTVYSLYGSEDSVLNHEKYEAYRSNLPADTAELLIAGGCHAGFGDYGLQAGDGEATITAMQQVQLTVDFIAPTD